MGPCDLPLPLLKWAIKVNIGSLVTNWKATPREGRMLIKRKPTAPVSYLKGS